MPKVSITPSFLKEGLVCPADKRRIEQCCDQVPGFFIEVRQITPGAGTYYYRYKNAYGKTTTIKLGLTSDIKLKDARAKAVTLREEIASGKNPKEEIIKKRNVPTLDTFYTEQYEPYIKIHKRSARGDIQMYGKHLKKEFGHLKLNNFKRSSVEQFHVRLRQGRLSPATCDHYIKLLRRMLNLALEWEIIDRNPLARIKLFREDNCLENYMNETEQARLLEVLRTHPNRPVCDIALYLLSTGARKNEALQAKWVDVDIDNRVWRVPASISKSKKMRSIPLNDSAIAVLKSLDTQGNHEYVFVNENTGKPFSDIKKGWMNIRKIAGLPKLRMHDLRHQYASLLVNSGRSLYEVQNILGHSDPKVTMRYSHLSSSSMQDAADAVSDRLMNPEKSPESPALAAPVALSLVHSGKS